MQKKRNMSEVALQELQAMKIPHAKLSSRLPKPAKFKAMKSPARKLR